MELLPAGAPRVFPAGRLDRESEGLLLLTDDGELTERLLHPSHHVAKEYAVLVQGHITEAALRRLREGVPVDGAQTAPAEVEPGTPPPFAGRMDARDVPEAGGGQRGFRAPDGPPFRPGGRFEQTGGERRPPQRGVWRDQAAANRDRRWPRDQDDSGDATTTVWLRFVLYEGRKRQIREMCAGVGFDVLRLIRVRMGPLSLGNLKPGAIRPLTPAEVTRLRRASGLDGGPIVVATRDGGAETPDHHPSRGPRDSAPPRPADRPGQPARGESGHPRTSSGAPPMRAGSRPTGGPRERPRGPRDDRPPSRTGPPRPPRATSAGPRPRTEPSSRSGENFTPIGRPPAGPRPRTGPSPLPSRAAPRPRAGSPRPPGPVARPGSPARSTGGRGNGAPRWTPGDARRPAAGVRRGAPSSGPRQTRPSGPPARPGRPPARELVHDTRPRRPVGDPARRQDRAAPGPPAAAGQSGPPGERQREWWPGTPGARPSGRPFPAGGRRPAPAAPRAGGAPRGGGRAGRGGPPNTGIGSGPPTGRGFAPPTAGARPARGPSASPNGGAHGTARARPSGPPRRSGPSSGGPSRPPSKRAPGRGRRP